MFWSQLTQCTIIIGFLYTNQVKDRDERLDRTSESEPDRIRIESYPVWFRYVF